MIVRSLFHAKMAIERIAAHKDYMVIDTETIPQDGFGKDDALIFGRARIKIWSLARRGESYSFPTNLFGPTYPTMAEYARLLLPHALDASIVKVFHNFNYDGNVFWTTTIIKAWNNVWDTMIGAWLANVALEKGLKARAPLYGRNLGSLYISKEMKKKGFTAVSMDVLDQVAEYAEGDVITTDELYQMQTKGYVFRPKLITTIDKNGRPVTTRNLMPPGKLVVPGEGPLSKFRRNWFRYHEYPVLQATMRAERLGFPYDVKQATKNQKQCAADKDAITKELYRAAGQKLNLNSTKQVVEQLFEPNGVECRFKTRKGNVSLNAASLFAMREDHPLIAKLEKYRKLEKLQSVYLGDPDDGSQGLVYFVAKDGRIHCTLNTLGAITGRFSSSGPNLQQIPARADIYKIRNCFLAPKGMKIVCIDYAQLELRVMALLCKDPAMSKILRDPKGDIHQNTADKFGVARNPTAKQLNFLMLYGGLARMLAGRLTQEGVPTEVEEAEQHRQTSSMATCAS